MLRLGILKTGRPPLPAIPQFGTYPDMFRRLLGEDAYDWRTYAVDEGELPASRDRVRRLSDHRRVGRGL